MAEGGSYTPIYNDIYKQLMRTNEVVDLHVLLVLAGHANHIGMTYTGQQKMMEYVHRTWPVIVRSLFALSERDWIRVHHLDQMGMVGISYQISPYIMYIREQIIDEAISYWDQALALDASERFMLMRDVRLVHTTSITIRESRLETRLEIIPETRDESISISPDDTEDARSMVTPPLAQQKSKSKKGKNQDKNDTKPETARSAKPARSAKTDAPPSSARPPQKDMTPWRTPLTDPLGETTAQLLAQLYSTRLSQARYAVDCYGTEQVNKAMAYIKGKQMAGHAIRNPMGLVMTWLQNNVITAADVPPEVVEAAEGADKYTNSKYADFIET